ncbi:patatin-like phospholipase family protein [Flexithrix dorotheae]|uniref:patatin-like phospholipase family protein n=1 Tax=Flexithrix dorotheae TaxID=70993 RepID=UPI000363C25F|nr:patatin-like phospholipase family protein [Flexithrix dorotheae]
MRRKILLFFILFKTIVFISLSSFGQEEEKVALVMSGGGALGIAHLGVIKALEENNIPIDYVIGTSMGGVIAGFYAAGYSVEEMEEIVLSEDFQNWVKGKFDDDYRNIFYENQADPTIISLKLGIHEKFGVNLKSSFINDAALNFALAELLTPASAKVNGNFDSLFVPFRCVTSDVFSQVPVVLEKGNLANSVRASMNIPLVFSPVKVGDRYLFDGGIYNNFPVEDAKKIFKPDFTIGVNVSSNTLQEYPYGNDEYYLPDLMSYILVSKSDTVLASENGVYIHPDLDGFSSFDFEYARELLEAGYEIGQKRVDLIKNKLTRRIDQNEVKKKRIEFRAGIPELNIGGTRITSLTDSLSKYILNQEKLLNQNNPNLDKVRNMYFHFAESDNFEALFPNFDFNPDKKTFDFNLKTKPNNNFKLKLGGALTNRSTTQLFLGLDYNLMKESDYRFGLNLYTGAFYFSSDFSVHIRPPSRLPFYISPRFIFNQWDYRAGKGLFNNVESLQSFVLSKDLKLGAEIGLSTGRKSKLAFSVDYFANNDKYSPFENLVDVDSLSQTKFDGIVGKIGYYRNNLNRKQFASRGHFFETSIQYIAGQERFFPGAISRNSGIAGLKDPQTNNHDWFRLKISGEQYFPMGKYTLGTFGEGMISNQPFFSNYKASKINAQQFYPLNDSRGLFLSQYRSYNYVAAGLKNIFSITSLLDLRAEVFLYMDLTPISTPENGIPEVDQEFNEKFDARMVNSLALVYHSFLGPVSANLNYYEKNDGEGAWKIFLQLGFLIQNKKALD